MPRAAGQPFGKSDYIVFVATALALILVAVTLTAMTGGTGRASCAAANDPSTSAPVGANCVPSGFAATQ